MSISQSQLYKLQAMIENGTQNRFYAWSSWLHTRDEVLKADHWECQNCRKQHRYGAAVVVHHVKHLRDRPDLALSVIDPDTGERQLVSLCRACHEAEHPERRWKKTFKRDPPLTVERWD